MKKQTDFLPGICDGAQTPHGSTPDPAPACENQGESVAEEGESVTTTPEGATSLSRKRLRLKPEQIQQIAGLLDAKAEALPVSSAGKSMEAAIKILAPKIRKLLGRGESLDNIAAWLRENEVLIATSTLQGYLPKKKKKKKQADSSIVATPAKDEKKRDGEASPASETNPLHPATPEDALS